MTKLLKAFLAIAVFLSLCACGSNTSENQLTPTQSSVSNDGQVGYDFAFCGVKLVPGESFAEEKFPEPQYIYTQINSALGGKDTIYNYSDIEVTVYDNAETTTIRSVIVVSPNLKTPEGLSLGDALVQVTKLYGSNYTQDGDVWLFDKGRTVLAILTQDGFVAGIEYRLAESNMQN